MTLKSPGFFSLFFLLLNKLTSNKLAVAEFSATATFLQEAK
jgi:hypothetical protein